MKKATEDQLREQANDILKQLDVSLYIQSTNGKPIPKETARLIWHTLLVGLMVNDLGGLKKFMSQNNGK